MSGIGARVRAARERSGLSREELAVAAGISWSAIAQVESGRRTNLRPATLSALAGALGVTIDYLVSGQHPGGEMFEHRALFYEDESQFLSVAVTFLVQGLERSEAELVVTSAAKLEVLREHLGAAAEAVRFADHLEWFSTPSEALATCRRFVQTSVEAGAPWVRILCEPVWPGRSQLKLREWSRYESLLNLVFSGEPVSLLCAYDRGRVHPRVVEVAYATHPDTVQHESLEPSPSYSDPGTFVLEE